MVDRLEIMEAQPLGQFASINLVTLVALFEQWDLAWIADQDFGHMRLEQQGRGLAPYSLGSA